MLASLRVNMSIYISICSDDQLIPHLRMLNGKVYKSSQFLRFISNIVFRTNLINHIKLATFNQCLPNKGLRFQSFILRYHFCHNRSVQVQ